MADRDVYTFKDLQYFVFQVDDGHYWAMPLDTGRPGKLIKSSDLNASYQHSGQTDRFADLSKDRRGKAQRLVRRYYSQKTSFLRLTFNDVVYILEAEYAFAQAALDQDQDQDHSKVNQLSTDANTTREALAYFWRRFKWDFPRIAEHSSFLYSLQDGFVGETAHVRACAALYSPGDVKYRCETNNPNRRFLAFMQPVPTYKVGTADAKTKINETLLAPRTVEDPVREHQKIYRAFTEPISAERKGEIIKWVAEEYAQSGQNVSRIGVWVRRVSGGIHTAAQNMSKKRFQQILAVADEVGIDEVIVLGDGFPSNDNWLKGTAYSDSTGEKGKRACLAFARLWEEQGIPRPKHQEVGYEGHVRGYGEQALVYSALYRNPDAQTYVNMSCIVTNKSGGPDLPSLAGVPQIQLAEMAEKESFVHHRMGFQSLCSPMWSVLRTHEHSGVSSDELTEAQLKELAVLTKRASALRTWHLQQIGTDRFAW